MTRWAGMNELDGVVTEMVHELQTGEYGPPTKPPTTVTVGTIDPDDEFWNIIEANWQRNQHGERIYEMPGYELFDFESR